MDLSPHPKEEEKKKNIYILLRAVDFRFLLQVPYWLTYDFPLEVREKVNREWGTDWKGQAQKW